jgi:hypothetical protein
MGSFFYAWKSAILLDVKGDREILYINVEIF